MAQDLLDKSEGKLRGWFGFGGSSDAPEEQEAAQARRNARKKGPFASASEFVGQMGKGATKELDTLLTGRRNPEDGPVLLCSNEERNQLYLIGGDQSVDLRRLGVRADHDSIILGECWAISYVTRKKFDDFEPTEYVHPFGPKNLQPRMARNADPWEDAEPPCEEAFGCGLLPTLRYDVLNQTLHLDGGSYFVTERGIED